MIFPFQPDMSHHITHQMSKCEASILIKFPTSANNYDKFADSLYVFTKISASAKLVVRLLILQKCKQIRIYIRILKYYAILVGNSE